MGGAEVRLFDGEALVGDAGYQKDPCTASGITDAFRGAEMLSEAIDAGFSGRQPLDEALAAYEQQRNESSLPLYELTCQLATLAPPPPEILKILEALQWNQQQRSRFLGVFAQTVPVPDFFAPDNVRQILESVPQHVSANTAR